MKKRHVIRLLCPVVALCTPIAAMVGAATANTPRSRTMFCSVTGVPLKGGGVAAHAAPCVSDVVQVDVTREVDSVVAMALALLSVSSGGCLIEVYRHPWIFNGVCVRRRHHFIS